MPSPFSHEREKIEEELVSLQQVNLFDDVVSETYRLLELIGNTNGHKEIVALVILALRNKPSAKIILL